MIFKYILKKYECKYENILILYYKIKNLNINPIKKGGKIEWGGV